MTNVIIAYYFSGTEKLHVWDVKSSSWFSVLAVSGGGRGQKIDGKRLPYGKDNARALSSISFKTKTDESRGIRGGPIPPGYYKIHEPAKNEHLGHSSYLEPDPSNTIYKRDAFYIHGSGKKGSDGCIVPGESNVFPILERIKELVDAYKTDIYLLVVSGEKTLPASNSDTTLQA